MHLSFLKHLVDPRTKEPLELQARVRDGEFVLEGKLLCRERSYPIVRGVPRFAGYEGGAGYTKSFAFQWNRWPRVQFESANVSRPIERHTLRMWERTTATEPVDLA